MEGTQKNNDGRCGWLGFGSRHVWLDSRRALSAASAHGSYRPHWTVVPVRDDVCRDIARWGEAYNPFKDPQQARNVDASPKPAESGGEGRRDRVAPPQATVAVQGVAVQRGDRASGSFPESPQHQTSSYMAIRAKLVPTRAIASTPLATCQPALSMIPLKASHAHSSRVAYGKRVGRRLTSSQSSTWKLGNRDVEHTNARSEHEPS